jgi:Uma2 family endonuclease
MVALPAHPQERYTVEQFEAFLALPENDDRLFELIDGEIVEKMPTELHNIIRQIVLIAIWSFVVPRRLGRVTSDTRTRASPDDRYNDRLPDIGFTTAARLLPIVERGAVPQIPDLCIEVQSPDDYPKKMHAKASYYLQHGAQQVWLIFTAKQLVEVHFPDGNFEHYVKGDTLTPDDLIPGFSIAIATIFDVSGL